MENQRESKDPMLISYMTLRKSIGILGIAFPFILIAGTILIGKCDQIQHSISHFYYTIMGDVFVGMLCSVSIFLITYKGYDKKDDIATNLAGLFALSTAFFPTSQNTDQYCVLLELKENSIRIACHYISAGLFFIILSYISFFLFTKTSGNITAQKITRNKIYRCCGVIIIFALLLIGINYNIPGLESKLEILKPVFWLESIALIAFGVSWLVKGEFILKDKWEALPLDK